MNQKERGNVNNEIEKQICELKETMNGLETHLVNFKNQEIVTNVQTSINHSQTLGEYKKCQSQLNQSKLCNQKLIDRLIKLENLALSFEQEIHRWKEIALHEKKLRLEAEKEHKKYEQKYLALLTNLLDKRINDDKKNTENTIKYTQQREVQNQTQELNLKAQQLNIPSSPPPYDVINSNREFMMRNTVNWAQNKTQQSFEQSYYETHFQPIQSLKLYQHHNKPTFQTKIYLPSSPNTSERIEKFMKLKPTDQSILMNNKKKINHPHGEFTFRERKLPKRKLKSYEAHTISSRIATDIKHAERTIKKKTSVNRNEERIPFDPLNF